MQGKGTSLTHQHALPERTHEKKGSSAAGAFLGDRGGVGVGLPRRHLPPAHPSPDARPARGGETAAAVPVGGRGGGGRLGRVVESKLGRSGMGRADSDLGLVYIWANEN